MASKTPKRTNKAAKGTKTAAKGSKTAAQKRASAKAKVDPASSTNGESTNLPAPVVGIGASAGGLEAVSELLQALPDDPGLTLVVVQHLDPHHESRLPELLGKATTMPVTQAEADTAVEPNHVYVIPPNASLFVQNGVLKLQAQREARGQHMSIDHFFNSLAQDQGARGIGIILSGTASDGTVGLRAVKSAGGLTFAQDLDSAKYDGMPRSAIAAGCVDFVLPPAKIAEELARIVRHPLATAEVLDVKETEEREGHDLEAVFRLILRNTGVDFRLYKHSTIKRRLMRRMLMRKTETLADYVDYLREHSEEIKELYEDILINVTSFFREPETFEALKEHVFPRIMENRKMSEPIRIWVPGCSTGEEVYSIAMGLVEHLGEKASSIPIQIFGTDLSEKAIAIARTGIYKPEASLEVSEERLKRFFVEVENGLQICRPVREMCIFAIQDVARDPPFSSIDLISCRNLLIYLGSTLQKRVMNTFHYALRPNGFLFLGSSETLGMVNDLFTPVDAKSRLYRRRDVGGRQLPPSSGDIERFRPDGDLRRLPETRGEFDVGREADRVALARYAPAGVIVTNQLDIVHFRGQTAPFLNPAPGDASLNLMRMVRPELAVELRTAIHEAERERRPVRRENVRVQANGDERQVTVEILPMKDPVSVEMYFLVFFAEGDPPRRRRERGSKATPKKSGKSESGAANDEVARLREELGTTKSYLQSVIEEQEATNEELRSANEEALSANEELQSTNEELETTREEVQSTNEELNTVNDELNARNVDFAAVNDDLSNLLEAVDLPLVMMGEDLHVRRFTAAAGRLLNLIVADVGRPFSHIKHPLDVAGLDDRLKKVLEDRRPQQQLITDEDGRRFWMRLLPYVATRDDEDGVVLVLVPEVPWWPALKNQKRDEAGNARST